jgi:hypothetical protein
MFTNGSRVQREKGTSVGRPKGDVDVHVCCFSFMGDGKCHVGELFLFFDLVFVTELFCLVVV